MNDLQSLVKLQRHREILMRRAGEKRYDDHLLFNRERGTEADSAYGKWLQRKLINQVYQAYLGLLSKYNSQSRGRKITALNLLQNLEPKTIAFLALKATLNSLYKPVPYNAVARSIGRLLEDEIAIQDIREEDEELFERLFELSQERFGYAYKANLFKNVASKENVIFTTWTDHERMLVGESLLMLVRQSTGLFEKASIILKQGHGKRPKQEAFLKVKEGCLDILDRYNKTAAMAQPVLQPMVCPPMPWTTPFDGGYVSTEVGRFTLVKTRYKGYLEELKHTEMPLVYQAVNAIQNTPYKIHDFMLGVMKQLREVNGYWSGIPELQEHSMEPLKPQGETEDETTFNKRKSEWKKAYNEMLKRNREIVSGRSLFITSVNLAEELQNRDIWFPVQLDTRGRVYCIPAFNYQGADWMKGLITLSRGKPIGEAGAYHLAVHIANLADDIAEELHGVKISKRPLDERAKWTEDYTDLIVSWAQDPFTNREWVQAGKKSRFQLLAAAYEWSQYKDQGADYVCSLPVAADGSNSGLQHYSAALRDPVGARWTNLLDTELPQDAYVKCSELCNEYQQDDLKQGTEEEKNLAKQWQEWGVGRSLVKRPVMTYSYSATVFGMSEMVRQDFLKPRLKDISKWEERYAELKDKGYSFDEIVANTGPKPAFPFDGGGGKASRYLAKQIWNAVSSTIEKAPEGMEWLKTITTQAIKNDCPMTWKTPTGFPVLHAYFKTTAHRIDTMIAGVGRITTTIRNETNELNKNSMVSAVAPNFIHSMDSSHLMLTVCQSQNEGIENFCLVHDSFATIPADMPRFFNIIRESMVKMYEENDVFSQFRRQIAHSLPAGQAAMLLPPPRKGNLDLKVILKAQYAFA